MPQTGLRHITGSTVIPNSAADGSIKTLSLAFLTDLEARMVPLIFPTNLERERPRATVMHRSQCHANGTLTVTRVVERIEPH